jgi:DNA-binding HxlR family transcriptional regulator
MARTHEKVGYLPPGKLRTYAPQKHAEGAERALNLLEGRWKMTIIFHLFAQPVMRFSELERAILAVSQKMLIQQLRELERDGIVERTIHPQVPPKVEYSLTEWGKALCPAVDALLTWGALKKIAPPLDVADGVDEGENS